MWEKIIKSDRIFWLVIVLLLIGNFYVRSVKFNTKNEKTPINNKKLKSLIEIYENDSAVISTDCFTDSCIRRSYYYDSINIYTSQDIEDIEDIEDKDADTTKN